MQLVWVQLFNTTSEAVKVASSGMDTMNTTKGIPEQS